MIIHLSILMVVITVVMVEMGPVLLPHESVVTSELNAVQIAFENGSSPGNIYKTAHFLEPFFMFGKFIDFL